LKPYTDKLSEYKTTIDQPSPASLLFDKYLIKQRQPSSIVNGLNDSITENLILSQKTPHSTSSFADMQDFLKDIECSKKNLDDNIKALWRNRDNSFLYCLTGTSLIDKDENERLRIKKLVDGYLNAITDDIEVRVSASVHAKNLHF
jgi:hypothetical protein